MSTPVSTRHFAYPSSLDARRATEDMIRGLGARRRDARPTLGQRFGQAFAFVRQIGAKGAVRNELNALSDRELADIGLSRCDVERVFDPAFAAEHAARH